MTSQTRLDDFGGLLNWANFSDWMAGQDLPGTGPVAKVVQLTGGSQNNLFLMERSGGSFVLRRPPKHLRANSNDTMMREARVLKALAGSDVPHPHLYASCDDQGVIGASFYVMAPLEGFSPIEELPGKYATDASWRLAMGEELVKAAVALGAVDYKQVGLEDFGKTENWYSRQVDRWRSQLEGYREMDNYTADDLPSVDKIGKWLTDNLPKNRYLGVIHGDYQFPNVMFSHQAPRITGLIDWELSTLGDPLLDLGWVLSSWWEEGDPAGKEPMVKPWNGFMTRKQLVDLYGQLSGRDMSEMPWFFCMACYKLGCILEGTYARAKAGKAPMEVGQFLHNYALWLFAKARQIIAYN